MKKTLYLFLSLAIVSCQAPIGGVSPDNKKIESVSGSTQMKKELASSDINSSIKKDFLSLDKNSFKINGLTSDVSKISGLQDLKIAKEDIKRKFVLNISSKGNSKFKPKDLVINVNNENIVSTDIDEEVSDISLPLENLKEGSNALDLGKISDKNLKVDIIGFVDPVDIPRAVHSMLMVDRTKKPEYVKGKVGIKFREGMKVRLNNKKLSDVVGVSLTSLEQFMKKYKVKEIAHAIGKDVELFDEDEKKAEKLFQTEVANQNLFYNLVVDENEDIWKLCDELKKLPFIEEAFPELVTIAPSIPYTATNDPLILNGTSFSDSGGTVYVNNDKWMKASHITATDANDSSTLFNSSRSYDNGAWSMTRGRKDVKIAVLDSGAEIYNSTETPYIPSTHPDLTNVRPISNVNVTGSYTDLNHGTASAGVIGATGNNNTGVAGLAYDADVTAIHTWGFVNGTQTELTSKCRGQGGGTTNCNGVADSILLARNLKNRIIVVDIASGVPDPNNPNNPPVDEFTVEQGIPQARAAITSAVANGTVVCVASGNGYNNNLLNYEYNGLPMPDTGSIIVGALKHNGSAKMQALKNGTYINYNYGRSISGGDNNLFTSGGHGVDVSASGQGVYTTFYNSGSSSQPKYGAFGASSAATPTVGAITALMLSVRPDLPPLEIRKTLRETQDSYNSDYYSSTASMPGMVNAYKAVYRYYSGGSSSATTPGLDAKFYANTIFPPETVLNDLVYNASLQENNVPYYRKSINNIDFNNGLADSFSSGLQYSYIANIQGLINFSQAGTYNFALYHDDAAILKIDGQEIIKQKNASDNYSYGSFNVTSTSKHSIQLLRNQEIGSANTVLWWAPPGQGWQIVPASMFSYTNVIASGYNNVPKPKLVGRFFNSTSLPILPVAPNPLITIGSRLYDSLNFYNTGLDGSDQFGIGYSDNFTGYFSGFIKLPAGYSSGNYTFTVGHDDGAVFYFNGTKYFDNPGPMAYTEDSSTSVYLQAGVYYPFVIQYYENLYDAKLTFYWTPQGGTKTLIPSSAFYH